MEGLSLGELRTALIDAEEATRVKVSRHLNIKCTRKNRKQKRQVSKPAPGKLYLCIIWSVVPRPQTSGTCGFSLLLVESGPKEGEEKGI